MTKKAHTLVQKLTLKLQDDEGKVLAKNIFDLLEKEKSILLLDELLSSSNEDNQIAGILLVAYLNQKELIEMVYKKVSPSSSQNVMNALFKIITFHENSSSQKFLLRIIEEAPDHKEVLDICFYSLGLKTSFFPKVLEKIFQKDDSKLDKLMETMFSQIIKKKKISLLKALLRQKSEKILLFACREIEKTPLVEITVSVTKCLETSKNERVIGKIIQLIPLFPETSNSIESVKKCLVLSPKMTEEHWQIFLDSFSSLHKLRERMVIDYFKKEFFSYTEDRQLQIFQYIGDKKSHYDISFFCRWGASGKAPFSSNAYQIIEQFPPQDSLYEMFQFFEESDDEVQNLLPLMVKISEKSNLGDMEELVSQFPPELQKKLIQKIQPISSSNLLISSLFKNMAREYSKLDEFGTILIGVNNLPRCYERDKEIQHIFKRFRREGNKSFVVVGPSGTGKSALFNELAHLLIANPNENYPFDSILQITTGDVLAGTKYLGEWETRVNKLIQTLKFYKKVILYVSNINDLIWAGRSSSSRTNFASVMAPYIERGEIVVVGESTPEAYSIGIGSEYNIKKLFQTIQLKELSDDYTEKVLRKVAGDLKGQMRRTKNIDVETPSTVLNRIIELGTYYFPGIARPGNAAHLLQQVIETRTDDFIQDEIPKIVKHLRLSPDDVMRTLSNTMEVPELIINDNIKLNLQDVTKFFSERVLGQKKPVSNLVSMISLIKAGLTNPERPHGVFFFIGPTGVGKTEMARVLAEYLTGNPDRLIRIDMSAFKDYSSFERLIGSHHNLTPQGTQITPNLVEKIRNHPFSVILLDEFEKAHPNIFDLFLQVFDYGKLLDARSEVIDFRQSIIIMTSNLGYEDALENKVGFEEKEYLELSSQEAKREMARVFRPEFINRIDRIVVFNPLTKDTMLKITHREIGKILCRSGILRRNLDIKVDESAVQLFLDKGFSPQLGARQLKRVVEQRLLHPLAETIVNKCPEHGSTIQISVEDGKTKVIVKESRAKTRYTRVLERVRNKNKKTTRLITFSKLQKKIVNMGNKVATLEEYCETKDYHHRKRYLLKKTKTVTFWDDSGQAKNILEEMHYLERILFSLSKLRKKVTDLESFMEEMSSKTSQKFLAQAILRFLEIKKEYEIVKFETYCETKKERADAFLTLSLAKPSKFKEENGIHNLYKIYSKWCDKNAFVIQPISEDFFSSGELKSLTCCIQGVCVYGILRYETGIHEIIKKEDSLLLKEEVKIGLLPKIGSPLKDEEFEIMEQENKNKAGDFFSHISSTVSIKHNHSNLQMKIRNNQSTSENISLLKDLMSARIHGDPAKNHIVRTYKYENNRVYIHDHILETSPTNMDEFLGGDIDSFLIERVQKIQDGK